MMQGWKNSLQNSGKFPGRHLLLFPVVLFLGVGILLVASYGYFLKLNWTWLNPAFHQFLTFMRSPQIEGSVHVAEFGWGLLLTLVLFSIGLFWALLLVPQHPKNVPSRTLLIVILTPVLGFCTVSLLTNLAVILGILHRPLLLACTFGCLVLQLFCIRRYRSRVWLQLVSPKQTLAAASCGIRNNIAQSTWEILKNWKTAFVAGVAVIVGLSFFHSLCFPITEWDSIIYHAGTARIWYENQPSPPTIYGSSVGIQMSGNYPALFPGMGAYYYEILGVFEDFFLRLISPLFFLTLILSVYYGASMLTSRRGGLIAALLIATTPIALVYAVWPTFYMVLAVLFFLCLLFFGLWLESRQRRYLWLCGIMLGLSLSTSYLALYFLGFLILAAIGLFIKKRVRFRDVILVAGIAMLLGSMWYIRNWIVLHDPVYPLGNSIFPSKGITTAEELTLFHASEAEIETNALGYWSGHDTGFDLLLQQIKTMFFDKHLLPFGGWLFIAGLMLMGYVKRPIFWLLALWVVFLAVLQLGIGWYWLRTLLLLLPAAAVVMAITFEIVLCRALAGIRAARGKSLLSRYGNALTRFAVQTVIVVVLIPILLVPGIVLAWAGPNSATWTTGLNGDSDFSWAWEHVGQTEERLYDVHRGDALAWRWLNENVSESGKVATLDNRIYWLRDPLMYFYMDGFEGVPLLDMTDPQQITAYLTDHQVEYLFVPTWVSGSGPAAHPIYDEMPIHTFLGTEWFPLEKVFQMNQEFSEIYRVGPFAPQPFAAFFNVDDNSQETIVPAGDGSPRLYLYTPLPGFYRMHIEYLNNSSAVVDVNRKAAVGWEYNYLQIERNDTDMWETRDIVFHAVEQQQILGLYARDDSLKIKDFVITYIGTGLEASVFGDEIHLNSDERLTLVIDSQTEPPVAKVLLHIPLSAAGKTIRIEVSTDGAQDVSIELWKGVILDSTEWWEHEICVVRAPELPVLGTVSPELEWESEAGLYTLMIPFWGSYSEPVDAMIEMTILP